VADEAGKVGEVAASTAAGRRSKAGGRPRKRRGEAGRRRRKREEEQGEVRRRRGCGEAIFTMKKVATRFYGE